MKGFEQLVTDRIAIAWAMIGLLVILGLGINALRWKPISPHGDVTYAIAGDSERRPLAVEEAPAAIPIAVPVGSKVSRSIADQPNGSLSTVLFVETPELTHDTARQLKPLASPDNDSAEWSFTQQIVAAQFVSEQPPKLGTPVATPQAPQARPSEPRTIPRQTIGDRLPVPAAKSALTPKNQSIKPVSTTAQLQPFFGVGIREPNSSRITTLYARSTAAHLGVKLGDYVQSLNGEKVSDIGSLKSALGKMQVGDPIRVSILRDGVTHDLGPIPLQSR